MKKSFVVSGIIVTAGIVIMVVAAIGGIYARAEWSDAYHAYVRSGEMYGAFEKYEAEVKMAAYAWFFEIGEIVAFGGLAIFAFGAAFEKIAPKPKGHKVALEKNSQGPEEHPVDKHVQEEEGKVRQDSLD